MVLQLGRDAHGVAGQGGGIEQVPLLGTAARVADHPGGAASQGDRVVPGVGERRSTSRPIRLPTCRESRSGRSRTNADGASGDPGAQRVAVGTVLDEAPGLKVGEKIHGDMIPYPAQLLRPTARPGNAREAWSGLPGEA